MNVNGTVEKARQLILATGAKICLCNAGELKLVANKTSVSVVGQGQPTLCGE